MLTDKKISIVVACYRDAGSILPMLERLTKVMARITPEWEVIYVNDDSPDNAEAVLIEQAAKIDKLTVISHARNFGAQVAFTTGMMQADGDAVVIMDGDLQDPPELIEDFVKLWLAGNDVVYGIRAKRHEGLVRNVGYKLFYYLFQKISYVPIALDAGEFSLMDRAVVEVILACPERDRLIRGLRSYAGLRQTGVPFERPKRYAGESTQGLLDYFMWVVKSFTSYSLFPLRFINFLAFCVALLLGCMAVYYLVAFLFGKSAPHGYMTVLLLGLSLAALVLFSLGIIGEYVGRLFIEIKGRPQPVLRLLINDHRRQPHAWLGRTCPRQPAEKSSTESLDQSQ
uniref:Glycosyltransferase n=1 Tax=Anaerolinea thermolimosa TaxID=229919 RepID=A0A7C4KJ46_9CHLR